MRKAISDGWNWLLIKLGLRTDWSDARYAPPFVPEVPHEFVNNPAWGLPCCSRCGAGTLHPVHHGKQSYVPRVGLSSESVQLMESAPGQAFASCDDPLLIRAATRNASEYRDPSVNPTLPRCGENR